MHLEGLTKEFYLGVYCKKNLQLVSLIVERIMTFQEWEVPTAASDQLPGHTAEDDLFRISAKKKTEYREYVTLFHQELLQLDTKTSNATNVYQLKEQIATNTKFPWRIMCITLKEVRLLIDFFNEFVCPNNKPVRNIVDKIEFFNDEDGILSEEPTHQDYKRFIAKEAIMQKDVNCSCPCNCIANRIPDDRQARKQSLRDGGQLAEDIAAATQRKVVKYFLFVKPPDIKEKKKLDGSGIDPVDVQVKKHILELLKEAETLEYLKITIMDQNSLSEIMLAIKQQIEKKKAFGTQDFKVRFVITSIGQRFSRSVAQEARREFQQFIQKIFEFENGFLQDLKNELMADVDNLKTQQKLLKERIDLCTKQNMIVHNLRRIKARSKFILHAQLQLSIYKFQPFDHLELIAKDGKSRFTAPYEEFKEKQKKEEEERKAKEVALRKK